MNWISFLSQVFFAEILTNVAGTVMFIIWFLCRKFFRDRNPKFVYYMLRWVIVMYMLPITYVAFITNYDSGYVKPMEGIGKMLFVIDIDSPIYILLMVVWLAMFTYMLFFCMKNVIGKYRISKCNFEDGASLAQTEFERIQKIIGVEDVILLRNDHPRLQTPFAAGVFKKKIVIPYFDYSRSELDVILYHELNHIKKKDVLFRYLGMIAIIMNCINPLVYILWKEILEWSEADCDAAALDYLEAEDYDKKNYYDVIWQMTGYEPKEPTIFYHAMLSESRSKLYRRMEIMERYRVNVKKTAKSVVTAGIMAVVLFSTVTAHAAGMVLAKTNDALLKASQEINVDAPFVITEGWSDEFLVDADDVIDTIYINDGVMVLAGNTFNWEVPVATRCVSASIYMTAGTQVQISCTATPTDCLYWFGLMYASSTCNVVEGTGIGAHVFTVPSNGYYRIMVENRGSVPMTVIGGYQY